MDPQPTKAPYSRVIIIGGGPAGLLTAQALKKQGIHATVYEQDAALDARPRDWNFGIYWAQVPLDDCLPKEISDQVENAQVDERQPSADMVMPAYNGETTELLKDIPIPFNIRLGRRRFCTLLTQGIDIKYGKRLQHVSSDGQTATAVFQDGSSETADLIVGADGAHSKVRDFIVGPERASLKPSPLVASITMAKLPAAAAQKFKGLATRSSIAFHPKGYFCWFGVHDEHGDTKPGDWTFMVVQSWMPTDPNYSPELLQGPAILQDMKRRGEQFSEPFDFMFQSIPEGTKCWHNRLSYWIPEQWNNRKGTVTLLGDAAHPMTFHRGQGLNNSIHDVASLARNIEAHGLLSPDGRVAAVSAYEREMCPRGRDAVITSNRNSIAIHNWDSLMQSPLFSSGMKQNSNAQS